MKVFCKTVRLHYVPATFLQVSRRSNQYNISMQLMWLCNVWHWGRDSLFSWHRFSVQTTDSTSFSNYSFNCYVPVLDDKTQTQYYFTSKHFPLRKSLKWRKSINYKRRVIPFRVCVLDRHFVKVGIAKTSFHRMMHERLLFCYFEPLSEIHPLHYKIISSSEG